MSQTNQPIERKKAFGGYTYSQNGKKLNIFQLPVLLGNNPEISKEMKKTTPMFIFSLLLVFVGVFMATFNLTYGIFMSVNWTGVMVGIVLGVVGYFLFQGPQRKVNELIDRYNAEL